MIAFRCVRCRTDYEAPNSSGGKICTCDNCGQRLRIPEAPPDHQRVARAMRIDVEPEEDDEAPELESPVQSSSGPSATAVFIYWMGLAVVVGVLSTAVAFATDVPQLTPAFIAGAWFVLSLAAALHYLRPPCPHCGERWTSTVWRHARTDGGPDRRYKRNWLVCSGCRGRL